MKKIKLQKGITLIALIITIVVLLILALVTIGVLKDSGIIGHAQNASNDYIVAQEKEKIGLALSEWMIEKNIGTKTFKDVVSSYLADTADVSGGANGPLTITMNKTKNQYMVSQDGVITGPRVIGGTELEKYILGEYGMGRNLFEIFDETAEYPTMINTNLDVSCLVMIEDTEQIEGAYAYLMYIKYNTNEYYKFRILERIEGEEYSYTTDGTYGVKLVEKLEENTMVGKYVKYDGKLWRVMYDDSKNGLQIICEEALTNKDGDKIYLGYKDPTIDASKVENYDDFSIITNQTTRANLEKALYSYNNAITTLNNICDSIVKKVTGITKTVRSVGSVPDSPTTEDRTKYSSEKLVELCEGIPNLNGKGYVSDDNYIADYERMIIIGNGNTINKQDYWLASRIAYFWVNKSDDIDSFSYGIKMMPYDESMPYVYNTRLVTASSYYNSTTADSSTSNYVRPVITLEEGIIKKVTGEGTATLPYDLDKYYEDSLIVNDSSESIPNGTYYVFGEDTETYITISDDNNIFHSDDTDFEATITINKGAVTMTISIDDSTIVFDGNYYETKNNKILTLGAGEFDANRNSKNSRLGFLFALNQNDLKYDITGSYLSSDNGMHRLKFTQGTKVANHSWSGNSTGKDYPYVGFKDMFYIDSSQVKYIGLEEGFGWDGTNGTFKKEN